MAVLVTKFLKELLLVQQNYCATQNTSVYPCKAQGAPAFLLNRQVVGSWNLGDPKQEIFKDCWFARKIFFLGGVERHHGRFGRITPSGDRHHHHHRSSDLMNQQKEVIRIGNKQSKTTSS